ncbi:HAD family phosphatase [Acaricomes phytoseiuli]|uniref:HAD family hydrolase n=1 Tax=Acaricomes phytoseiuli TaxID=291968 RepID=UPI00036F85F8|nr:HAD family phosphatase [Acaricomes phytoseiuli]MCW1250230.1 HAD family phosphatase [Acaricomes phytoseiuli]
MTTWYLFDYGMVISQAPKPADWQRLRELSGHEFKGTDSPYWAAREEYDAGRLGVADYWRLVLGRPEASEELIEALHHADLQAWSHLNPSTETVLAQLQSSGGRLALLSNMPTAMAEHYARTSQWATRFEALFFSGRLGMVKPGPRIYQHVLEELGVPAQQVIFIDDRQENLDAAAALGMRTVLHHPGVDLAAALSLPQGPIEG